MFIDFYTSRHRAHNTTEAMIWKIIFGVLAIVIAVMFQYEVDDDVLLCQKGVAIAASRAKVFMYMSDMRNQAKVCHTT